MPSVADLHSCHLQVGDIVVTATDGLWDNLRDSETAALVYSALAEGKGVAGAANAVCLAAHRVGQDPRAMSPFAVGAAAAGIRGVRGGKPDDTTVVVAQVAEVPTPAA